MNQAIRNKFFSECEYEVVKLPTKKGGVAIRNPSEISEETYMVLQLRVTMTTDKVDGQGEI